MISTTDYYAFGSALPGRSFNSSEYSFGFQGQEKDDEIADVEGAYVNYKYRMHNTRLGRFFSVDPLTANYPHNSPYAFSENRVIDGIELEGLEVFVVNGFRPLKFDVASESEKWSYWNEDINFEGTMIGYFNTTDIRYIDGNYPGAGIVTPFSTAYARYSRGFNQMKDMLYGKQFIGTPQYLAK